jgi:hypothetical protein
MVLRPPKAAFVFFAIIPLVSEKCRPRLPRMSASPDPHLGY